MGGICGLAFWYVVVSLMVVGWRERAHERTNAERRCGWSLLVTAEGQHNGLDRAGEAANSGIVGNLRIAGAVG
jgi:hypothetical protein